MFVTDSILSFAKDQQFAENVVEDNNNNNGGFGGGYNNGGFGGNNAVPSGAGDGFMNIPDGIDEELPFN